MDNDTNAVELATELTIAWLGNPNTRSNADDVPAFLQSMHAAVTQLATLAAAEPEQAGQQHVPAVTVRKSLASPEHIISMIDGKPYKSLRRHLSSKGLTLEEYRQRYGLKTDYPMVASSYSEARRAMAKTIGLSSKPSQTVNKAEAANEPAAKPATKTVPAAPRTKSLTAPTKSA